MNSDKFTTILGIVMAVVMALGSFAAPVGTPEWLRIVGYIGAVATAVFGFFTNKPAA